MRKSAFTLAEVLICLVLLGAIAAFTVPKLLISINDTQMISRTKEASTILTSAYQQYKLNHNNVVPASMTFSDLLPYINHLGMDTTSIIDSLPRYATQFPCSSEYPCLKLPNGAMIAYHNKVNGREFGATTNNRFIWLLVDPDGKCTYEFGHARYKSIQFLLYYDGALKTMDYRKRRPNSMIGLIPDDIDNNPAYANIEDPDWFRW